MWLGAGGDRVGCDVEGRVKSGWKEGPGELTTGKGGSHKISITTS